MLVRRWQKVLQRYANQKSSTLVLALVDDVMTSTEGPVGRCQSETLMIALSGWSANSDDDDQTTTRHRPCPCPAQSLPIYSVKNDLFRQYTMFQNISSLLAMLACAIGCGLGKGQLLGRRVQPNTNQGHTWILVLLARPSSGMLAVSGILILTVPLLLSKSPLGYDGAPGLGRKVDGHCSEGQESSVESR